MPFYVIINFESIDALVGILFLGGKLVEILFNCLGLLLHVMRTMIVVYSLNSKSPAVCTTFDATKTAVGH